MMAPYMINSTKNSSNNNMELIIKRAVGLRIDAIRLHCQVEQCMRGTGPMSRERVMENSNGLTGHAMKASGSLIKLTVKVNSITQMEISTKESGKMTKLTGKVLIHMQMELVTRVNGKTINSMVMVRKPGQM